MDCKHYNRTLRRRLFAAGRVLRLGSTVAELAARGTHRTSERALRPGPPPPRSADALDQGHDCRRGASELRNFCNPVAAVGGDDGRHRDADECGTVAQGNVRLFRPQLLRRAGHRRHRAVGSAITHVSPFASTVDRILEVALGGVIGFAISFFLLPSSAHPLVVDAAAGTLDEMAALGELLAGFTQSLDVDSVTRIQDRIGQALVHMNVVGSEAEHERSARLAVGPNTEPLLRTLLRLRHDLVMIGRGVIVPLPEAFQTRLELPLAPVGVAFADYLRASGVALSVRRGLPSSQCRGSGSQCLRRRDRHAPHRRPHANSFRRRGRSFLCASIRN